ncbi:MAG: ATP-binding protein [Candidatus Dependentiae bacterium]|nr:ATP-binding protein [Candidatus Dependentiae bacterium]
MLTRDMICSLALCMSMISTIHANGVQMALQKEFIEQEQNNIPPVIKEEVATQQLSEYEQRILDALPQNAKDYIAQYKERERAGNPWAPKLMLEVPESIQERDMADIIAKEMGIPYFHITKKTLSQHGNRVFLSNLRKFIATLRTHDKQYVALIVDSIDQFEHCTEESRLVCDILSLLREVKVCIMLTAHNIENVDPLIQSRFEPNFKMESMSNYWERLDLVSFFLRYELEAELVGDRLISFIAQHTDGLTAFDMDMITTQMRSIIARGGGSCAMPLDCAYSIIGHRKHYVNRQNRNKHTIIEFCKNHPVVSSAAVLAITGVAAKFGINFINKYRNTHEKK